MTARPAIKAIETTYAGRRFRSRLEARWAVFFDVLGVPWKYEPEGFDMDGVRYLPDFLIGKGRSEQWFEVKGTDPSSEDLDKIKRLAKSERDVVVAVGEPYAGVAGPEYDLYLYHGGSLQDRFGASIAECLICNNILFSVQYNMYQSLYCDYCDFANQDWPEDKVKASGWEWHKGSWIVECGMDPYRTTRLKHAYQAAISARFEHGENGRSR